jgi:hypothetical protein
VDDTDTNDVLEHILAELENAPTGLSLDELGRRLGTERSALEGMIAYLVRKGKLQDDESAQESTMAMCESCNCGASCPGPQGCPFVMAMPRTFSLSSQDGD